MQMWEDSVQRTEQTFTRNFKHAFYGQAYFNLS